MGITLDGWQNINNDNPHLIGQASRISGVSPADISVLLVFLRSFTSEDSVK